jgi:hypothetical protein
MKRTRFLIVFLSVFVGLGFITGSEVYACGTPGECDNSDQCASCCTNCTYSCYNQDYCIWSVGNTCTQWCDNGSCLPKNDGSGECNKNQKCCLDQGGSSYLDTRVVGCDCDTGEPTNPGPSCYSPGAQPEPTDNCLNAGLVSKFTEDGKLVEWKYACGPTMNDRDTCGWWYSTYDGYFNAPESREYQFMIKEHAGMKVQIDVDGNGSFDACKTNESIGDQFFFYNRGCYETSRAWDFRQFIQGAVACSIADCGYWGTSQNPNDTSSGAPPG